MSENFSINMVAVRSLEAPLRKYLDEALEEFFSVRPDMTRISPEEELHQYLLNTFVCTSEGFVVNMYKEYQYRLWARNINMEPAEALLSKRVAPKIPEQRPVFKTTGVGSGPGRPTKYHPLKHNRTFSRAVKVWLLNKLIAKGLGVELTEAPPSLRNKPDSPPEIIEQLYRFEKWTGFPLPTKAFAICTRTDRILLMADERVRTAIRRYSILTVLPFTEDWQEDSDPCLKLEEYIRFHRNPELRKVFASALGDRNIVWPQNIGTKLHKIDARLRWKVGQQITQPEKAA